MLDQKEFLKKLKLIFYQLFNRKLPFVVFDKIEPVQNNAILPPSWLFTNIDYETILAYDSKPDYFCASVSLLDKEFYTMFYQLFPLLKDTPCIIRSVDFLSSLMKADDITLCSLYPSMSDIILTYVEKGNTVNKVVGIKLLDIDVEMYRKVYESGLFPSVLPARKEFKAEDLANDKFIIETEDGWATEEHVPRKVRVIIQVGLTVPSLPIFLKNYKEDDSNAQTCELVTGYDGDSVVANSRYTNHLLCCTITQPAQRWFVRKNQPEQKGFTYVRTETTKAQEQHQEAGSEQGLGKQDPGSQGKAGSDSCSGNCADCAGTCGKKA